MLLDRGIAADHATLFRWGAGLCCQAGTTDTASSAALHWILASGRDLGTAGEFQSLIQHAGGSFMSLHPTPIGETPTETARIAGAAFPKGTLVTRLRDGFSATADRSHSNP
jgi:hypothetical protein